MANNPMPSREAAESAAAAWIARLETPEWDAEAFERWLADSVSHRVAYYRLHAVWLEAGRLRVLASPAGPIPARPQPEFAAAIEDHHKSASVVPRARSSRRVLGIAASVVLVAAGGLALLSEGLFSKPNHFATVVGGLEAVPLADGSRVTLNTDSELRVSLESQKRIVNLDRGEAYFEVAKDKSRPFIVNAGHKRVIAVGTQFSVRREGDNVQVVVTEGTVRMEARDSSVPAAAPPVSSGSVPPEVLISAGSVARTQADAVLVRQEMPAEIEQHLSWRSGLLTFRDTPLADAVAEFNRYNDRKIVIEDPSISSLQLGGVFRTTNVEPFIDLLEQGFPVRATIEGNRILLTHN